MTAYDDRIATIPDAELSPAQREALTAVMAGRGFLPTPYKVWLHSPELVGLMEALGTFLNKRSSLTPREVEIAVLVVARHWTGDMVFDGHAATAAELGIPSKVVTAISAKQDAGALIDDARERAVYAIASAAELAKPMSDEEFARATVPLGRNGLAEVLALIGYFSAVAIAMKLHRVASPPPKITR